MNKKILLFLGCVTLFTTFNESKQVNADTYDANNWSVVATTTNTVKDCWTINEDSLVSTNNLDERSNFLVSNELVASGDYTVTCDILGTMDFPNSKLTHAGIVPWYLDNNNYIVIYMQWHNTERNNQLHQVQVTGRIDGQFLSVWKNNVWNNSSEWNDCWTDGKTISSTSNPTLKVERKAENHDAYRYKIYINDIYIGEHGIRSDMESAQKEGKIGFYAYNDTFTFTNINKITGNQGGEIVTPPVTSPIPGTRLDQNGNWEFYSPDGANESAWSIDSNNVIKVNGHQGTQWLKTSALQNNNSKKDFIISADMDVTTLGTGKNPYTNEEMREYKVGLVPYYKDDANYCFVWYSRWSDGKDCEIIVTAKVNGSLVTSPEFTSSGWQTFDLTGKHNLKVQVKEDFIQVWINNSPSSMKVEAKGFADRDLTNSKVGLNIKDVQATFTNINLLLDATEENPKPNVPVIDPSGWEFISPASATSSLWSVDAEGNIIGSGEHGTEWQNTSAYKPNTDKKNFVMESTIEVLQLGEGTNIYNGSTIKEYKAGFVPYFKDFDNFCFIWLSQWADGSQAEISVTCKVGGKILGSEEFMSSGWLSFGIQTKVSIEVEVLDNMINVYINNKTTIPSCSFALTGFANRNLSNAKVGFNIVQCKVKFSEIRLLLDERTPITEKPVITETGTRITESFVNKSIKLPIYTGSNSYGMSLTPVISVVDPNGDAVEVVRSRFTPTIIGIYVVTVSCEDVHGNQADPITYNINIIANLIPETPGDSDNPNEDNPGNITPPSTNEFFSNLGVNPNDTFTSFVVLAVTGTIISVGAIIFNIILKKRLK